MSLAFLTSPTGGRFQLLASAAQTSGAFGLVAVELTAGDQPPLHVHHGEDEAFYLLDGRVDFTVGDELLAAGPGGFVYAPRDVPHRFEVRSPSARMLTLVTPGGLEAFFAVLAEAGDQDDLSLELAMAAEHRFEILAPPLQPQL